MRTPNSYDGCELFQIDSTKAKYKVNTANVNNILRLLLLITANKNIVNFSLIINGKRIAETYNASK